MTYKPNNEPVYAVIDTCFDVNIIRGIFRTKGFAEEYALFLYEQLANQHPILVGRPWSSFFIIEEADFYE